ncbi:ABC-2 type transport system ATP-binding protein [Ruminococcaceae bacterium YRB3002]|nr:ABC-2 type transport system ATP-binding protein [Ruminococcaceae bacterium YRB3002]
MDSDNFILTLNDISKSYGKHEALKDVTVKVPKGSIFGLIGKNGAGKTTIMRIIAGLQEANKGTVSIACPYIGALIDTPAYYSTMNAYENLKIQFINLGLTSYGDIPDIINMVGLDIAGRKPVMSYSFGMRQRLGLGIALCGNPDLVILDEPINGLDPQGIVAIRELILKINRERGTTFIISSHLLDELAKIATHYAFIDNGQIIRQISAEEMHSKAGRMIRARVTNAEAFCRILDDNGLKYELSGDSEFTIDGEITLAKLDSLTQGAGCELLEFNYVDTSLEGYFIDLLEG